MNEEKWDRRWLDLAKHVSTYSKDPSTQVGAVLAKGKEFIMLGYNGFSQYDKDINLEDRDYKLSRTIHAEINAILFAKRDLTGASLYTYPFLPCSSCAAIVSQVGIHTVVSYKNTIPRWEKSINEGKYIMSNGQIQIIEYLLE